MAHAGTSEHSAGLTRAAPAPKCNDWFWSRNRAPVSTSPATPPGPTTAPAKVSTSAWEKRRAAFAVATDGPPVASPGAAESRLTSMPAAGPGDMEVAPGSTGAQAVGSLINSAAPKRPRSIFPIATKVPPTLTQRQRLDEQNFPGMDDIAVFQNPYVLSEDAVRARGAGHSARTAD